MQKMPVIKGDSPKLECFINQFQRVAAHKEWSANKKAFRLLDCLGNVALEYAQEVNKNGDYKDIKRHIQQIFSRRSCQFLLVVSYPSLNSWKILSFKTLHGAFTLLPLMATKASKET